MNENLPKNSIEAQGLLIKAFYEKFGDEILPIIDEVLGLQGRALGLKIKKKIPDNKLSTVANAFVKNFNPKLIKVVSLSDQKFHIQGMKCPFGIENTSRKLCEAVMAIDREYFFTATDGKTKLEILKTVAAGDKICDTIYTNIEKKD
ncbi:MAG: methanogen output domain 1-containing protein [Candidatus Helarchaeota archaeon]